MKTFIVERWRRFRREEDGSIIAETVIMFPTLFAAVLATFVFFDAFRNQAISLKANYTISDAVSRQDFISPDFLENTWNLQRFLTDSPTFTELRISVVQYDQSADEFTVVWSRQKGLSGDVDNGKLSDIGLVYNQVPSIPDGDVLIVVQTGVDYEPDFSIGLKAFTFDNVVFTEPRYAKGGQLCWAVNANDPNMICPLNS